MWSTTKEQLATIWLHKSCNDDGTALSQRGHLLLLSYENVCLSDLERVLMSMYLCFL